MSTHPLEGVVKLVKVDAASTGAGDTSAALRPSAGCLWEVLTAWGFQDDGAVAMAWHFTDPDNADVFFAGYTAGASYERLDIGSSGRNVIGMIAPPICTYDRYWKYHFTASAGGKNCTILAIVKEFRGVAVEA